MNTIAFATVLLQVSLATSLATSTSQKTEKLLEYPNQVVVPNEFPSVYACEDKAGKKTSIIPAARYLEGHFHGWQAVIRFPEDFLANGQKEKEQSAHASRLEPFTPRGVAAGRTAAKARIRVLIRQGYQKETILRACRAAILPPIEARPLGRLKSPQRQLEMKDGELRFRNEGK